MLELLRQERVEDMAADSARFAEAAYSQGLVEAELLACHHISARSLTDFSAGRCQNFVALHLLLVASLGPVNDSHNDHGTDRLVDFVHDDERVTRNW